MNTPDTFNTLSFRLRQMLFGWGGVGIVYNLSDRFQGPGQVLDPGFIDRLIPYSPHAVWPYLSFFLIIPLAFLTCPAERLRWLRSGFQVAALAAGTVFMLWPTTLVYPDYAGAGLSSTLLAGLLAVDSAQNCFPSLHMALTTLAILALDDPRRPLRKLLLWAWGALIGFSILQLRRHLAIDLVSGVALGFAAAWLCRRWLAPTTVTQGAPS
ncbi:phosphatase PAP2 family protein [Azonexus sp.]|uniref:phosphatase PAP2 family protein n=1 Tax=Azonexus sp. TaxID=1872668 RepID=UPI0035AE496A